MGGCGVVVGSGVGWVWGVRRRDVRWRGGRGGLVRVGRGDLGVLVGEGVH